MQRKLSRRNTIKVLAGAAGYILGEQVLSARQSARGNKAPLMLILDGMGAEAIVIKYRGQTVSISPQDIIDALK